MRHLSCGQVDGIDAVAQVGKLAFDGAVTRDDPFAQTLSAGACPLPRDDDVQGSPEREQMDRRRSAEGREEAVWT